MSDYDAVTSIVVFWDTVDCKIHDGLSVWDVSNNIEKALKDCGYNGKVSIMAYGETDQIKDEFLSAGIEPIHVTGDKFERVKNIFLDMLAWALDNPETNLMLVMGLGVHPSSWQIKFALQENCLIATTN